MRISWPLTCFLYMLGHTADAVIEAPEFGPANNTVVAAMKSVHVLVQGSVRTWYGFYRGMGGIVSLFFIFPPVLTWHLGGMGSRMGVPLVWVIACDILTMREPMMRRYLGEKRNLVLLSAVGALALGSLAVVSLTGQTTTPSSSAKSKSAGTKTATATPRTAWGSPDLQGTWFVVYDVPLERSAANANKPFLTDAEVAAANERKEENPGRNERSTGAQDVSGAYNAVFNSVLKTGKRTSMIIDPPDGRIPPLVSGAQPQGRGFGGGGGGRGAGAPLGLGVGGTQNDNPETVAQSPRCLGVAMPFLPLNTLFAQGTVMQIVQSPKSMGIYMEDDHAGGGNRVIYMDGRPHAPPEAKFYLGDSRGHWEGNTLVIETTNYSQGFRGSNIDTYKTIERLTRVDATHLNREITFVDPKTWTKPWTVLIEMQTIADKEKHMIFDSACHEGNYGMTGILVGSRREEQAAAAKSGKK